MDLSNFDTSADADTGAVMEVRNPHTGEVVYHDGDDGKPDLNRPFTIKLVGKDSQKVVTLGRQQADRRIQHTNRTKLPVTMALLEKDEIELAVVATLEWDVILDGKKPDNDPKAYRAAYAKYSWLYEQVVLFIGTRANFTKA
jgi:hypothetical protein